MKNLNRPGFILAIVGTALIFIGLMALGRYDLGEYILYAGCLLVGIVWVWSIWDVIVADDLKYYQKMFWLIITISVPVMGGVLFYVMHQRRNKIVT